MIYLLSFIANQVTDDVRRAHIYYLVVVIGERRISKIPHIISLPKS